MGVKTVIQVVLSVIALAGVASFYFWDCLSGGESLSATLRNIFLIVGTPLAMFLAVWRSKIAQDQVEVAQVALLSARYQRAVEMLGHDLVSIRIGGIESLRDIAREHNEYRQEVVSLLYSFLMTSDLSALDEGKVLQEAIIQLADRDSDIREHVERMFSAYSQ